MKNKCLQLITNYKGIGSKINLKCVSNDTGITKSLKEKIPVTVMTLELSREAVLIFVHVFEQGKCSYLDI